MHHPISHRYPIGRQPRQLEGRPPCRPQQEVLPLSLAASQAVQARTRGGAKSPSGAAGQLSGFTLIELTLAIFVFAIGVLTVFLLLGRSLDEGQATVRYTRLAQFGENVMDALEQRSEYYSENPGTNGDAWVTFWSDLAGGDTGVVVAASGPDGVWSPQPEITCGALFTNVFVRYPLHESSATGIVSHAVRYKLRADLGAASADPARTNLAVVTLRVWEGQFGETVDRDALILYTWFMDRGCVR